LSKVNLRGSFRLQLCSGLLQQSGSKGRMSDSGHSRDHVAPLLDVLVCVIEGLGGPLGNVHFDLLTKLLLPLHKPNEMIEWRDQIPVLQSYYGPLLRCMTALVIKANSLGLGAGQTHSELIDEDRKQDSASHDAVLFFSAMVDGIVQQWPQSFASNTPKEVLLLDEIEKIIALANQEQFTAILPQLLSRISTCVGGDADNFRTVQRTLQMFKNKKILALIGGSKYVKDIVFAKLIPALYRGGKLSWNPTVNKMTALALRNIRDIDPEEFSLVANRLVSTDVSHEPLSRAHAKNFARSGSHNEAIAHSETGNEMETDGGDPSAKRMRPPVGRMSLPPSASSASRANHGLGLSHAAAGFGIDSTGLPVPLDPNTVPAPSRWRPNNG
jgi:Protein phosphatase 2A regulatory B subunit (B56 family)